MKKPWVAYVGPFEFPSDSASAFRVRGMTEAMIIGGANVVIGSGNHGETTVVGIGDSDGVRVQPLGEIPTMSQSRFKRVLQGLTWGGQTLRWLRNLDGKPDVIVVYGTHIGYLLRLIPFARRNRIRLYLDVVEWYEPKHLPGGRLGPFTLANEIAMRFLAPKADGIFCISSYLSEYFERRGCSTLRVPPLFSKSELVCKPERRDGPVRFCFAGTAGGKDRLTIQNAVAIAGEQNFRTSTELHLVGLSPADVQGLTGCNPSPNVHCHGRMTRDAVLRIVASSDFSLLQRPQLRYANAGFPSKVVESLLIGTPVVTNITSDLGEYLRDNFNAVVLDDDSLGSMRKGMAKATSKALGTAAFDHRGIEQDARVHFTPDSVADQVKAFIRS